MVTIHIKKKAHLEKGIKFEFTGTILEDHEGTYFGMSTYEGNPPYFDIGYNQSNKKVNVTAIRRKRDEKTEDIKATDIYEYTYYKILYVGNKTFKKDDKIIVECTLNETTDVGFWAYVGSHDS